MKPKILVLSGGGVRALSFIGSLSVLDASGMLTDIKSYYGVSAGALIIALMLIGYTIPELVIFLETFDLTRFQHIEVDNLLNVTESLGVDCGDHFIQTLREIFESKAVNKAITFQELYDKTGCEFNIFATNLNKLLPVKLSHKTTPHLQVIQGLRITMSVPGWLTPVQMPDANRLLIDGGIYNNYPIVYVPVEERKHVLGISIDKTSDECTEITDIASYVTQIISALMYSNINRNYKAQTLFVLVNSIPFLKFDLSISERKMLLDAGTQSAIKFLSENCEN